MSSNYCVIPECYIDSCLVEVLLNAGKESVNHQKGNGTVAKKMKEAFNDEFCIGIIDEDKAPIDYLKEFDEKKSDEFLKLWKHRNKHHYIIQIRPVVEIWFLKMCDEKGINLIEYDLPHGGKELLRKTKSVSSRYDERFINLFGRLINENSESVLRLKNWIEFLKKNKYKSNLDLLLMSDEIKKEAPANFKVTIDNITIEVAPGTTILNAARQIGGDVTPPAMCYYSKLQGSGGKCRTCLVEVAAGSTADPRPMPKLVASCRTNVMDGMVVKNITSEKVTDARNGVVEFLLINHPLDCPICDQAGECDLQDLGYNHGKEGTRYEFKRRTFEKEDIGPYIQLHMTRCILCYRCTYVADQLTDNRVHGILDRGDHSEISTYIAKAIDNDFSGNMIDVCPVGALTDKTFRFKNRVWFTKPVNAHRDCEKCCGKVTLWQRGDEVLRVTARKDEWGEVQSYDGKPGWICNDCRFHKKKISDWVIEGLTNVNRHSVIAQNKYPGLVIPKETIAEVMGGRDPKLLMDIHSISDVNDPSIDLSLIEGPATSETFKNVNGEA